MLRSRILLSLTSAAALAFSVLIPAPSWAEEAPPLEATPSGQVLLRYRHFEGHDFASGGGTDTVRQRTRVGLHLKFADRVDAFVQIQDVRTWGEEADTLGDFSADGLDLHQGYLGVRLAEGMALKIGRQEISYLNQRLIGNVGFIEQARSFDAARWSLSDGDITADAFYARTRDGAPGDFAGVTDVFAGFFQYRVHAGFVPALIAVADIGGPAGRTRVTAGLHATGALDFGLSYSLEGYFQGGSAADGVSYAAVMTALHARYTVKSLGAAPFFELFGELASGDDDPGDADVTSFDTLFATNHKFYGEMDFFLNLPVNTAQRGLIDLGAVVGAAPADDVTVKLTGHYFLANNDQGGDAAYGTELDLKGTWKANAHLAFDLLYAVFLPGDGLTGDTWGTQAEHFVYATANASF